MVKLLDCTLRDGGHVVGCDFGKQKIRNIVKSLEKSNCDIIELGFLMDKEYTPDKSIFNSASQAKPFIGKNSSAEYSLLFQQDQFNDENLEMCDGSIKHIRISFHTYDKVEGLLKVARVKNKGYDVHINPINFANYSDNNVLAMIDDVNKILPHTFTIVDTFGSLDLMRFKKLSDTVLKLLDPTIEIGIHLHENLASSLVLAQYFLMTAESNRKISIDASLDGMGKIPGNLPMELIMDYVNKYMNGEYKISELYECIDKDIKPIKIEKPWGYSAPFAMAAQRSIHRSYAAFGVENGLTLSQLDNFFSLLEKNQNEKYSKGLYNKEFAEDTVKFVR